MSYVLIAVYLHIHCKNIDYIFSYVWFLYAEFTYRVFECVKEVTLLRVLTDEDHNNLPGYWHA